MENILSDNQERYLFENELKAKGCVELIKCYIMNETKDSTETIMDILNLLFNYYMCLGNSDFDEEVTLEEKIQYLYYEEVIDEETKNKWLYLCEVINDLYKMDESMKV